MLLLLLSRRVCEKKALPEETMVITIYR